jgi:four helix bundle protein
MTNVQQNSNSQNPKKYDLADRTMKFSKNIIDLSRKIPENNITKPLVDQLVRAGTSIGANYCEADEASSKKDFINKVCISKKETKETKYWLQLLAHSSPNFKDEARILWKEAQELNLILAAIIRKCKE